MGQAQKFDTEKKTPRIAMLDLAPGISVGQLRRRLLGGLRDRGGNPRIVGAVQHGRHRQGQTGMEQLLQKDPGTNLVYSINEPSGFGAATALRRAGKNATIVSVDGGCEAIRNGIKEGVIGRDVAAVPAEHGEARRRGGRQGRRGGPKPTGYEDTGVTLITDDPVDGVESKDSEFGLENCWG